jgi:hypothetical protein
VAGVRHPLPLRPSAGQPDGTITWRYDGKWLAAGHRNCPSPRKKVLGDSLARGEFLPRSIANKEFLSKCQLPMAAARPVWHTRCVKKNRKILAPRTSTILDPQLAAIEITLGQKHQLSLICSLRAE